MKTLFAAGCAVLSFAIAGCVASSDQAPPSESIGQTSQAKDRGSEHVVGNVYTFWSPTRHELDIQTCNVVHDPNMDDGNIALHPCTLMFPDRKLDFANVLVRDASGKILDVHVVDDRPGGGCIHVQAPEAAAGGSMSILVLGKNIDGSGAHIAFLNQGT